jgi:hypothetical protein
MHATAPVFQTRQVLLRGLEVLRLIADRLESRQDVANDDLRIVLDFMCGVAHPCLHEARLQIAETLFAELNRGEADIVGFVTASRSYTTLLSDFFLTASFEDGKPELREAARRHAPLLHQLETKYTIPHCI